MTINPNRQSKRCSLCKSIKNRDDFYQDRTRKDLMSAYCKKCSLNRNKKWRELNPESSKDSSLWTRRKLFYGITKEEFFNLLEEQNYLCAICKIDINKSAHVDHCHSSKKIRGLLCSNCNKGLGMFKDNIKFLESAIQYLK
jgi:hypothetical protein